MTSVATGRSEVGPAVEQNFKEENPAGDDVLAFLKPRQADWCRERGESRLLTADVISVLFFLNRRLRASATEIDQRVGRLGYQQAATCFPSSSTSVLSAGSLGVCARVRMHDRVFRKQHAHLT